MLLLTTQGAQILGVMTMNVIAVVVSYKPELEKLRALLEALVPQVEAVVVVDNGSESYFRGWIGQSLTPAIHGVFLRTNTGIAAAQNVGISWARRHGADYVVLFDQDSLPAQDMVRCLVEAADIKRAEGYKVAAVGPRYLDKRQNNPPPFVKVRGLRVLRQGCGSADLITETDYLISSGCLIPVSTIDSVGAMREDLFIDYVDIEWGLRAQRNGFQSFGVFSARMLHSLGDTPIRVFGRSIPLHSPLRHYYHFRNAVILFAEPWIPLNWRLVNAWRLCLKYVVYALLAKPRVSHWWMMTLGVWHGLLGRTGRLSERGKEETWLKTTAASNFFASGERSRARLASGE
jgi:rhamnosyltransferase